MTAAAAFKAVVFDIDGVLLHLTPAETQSFVGAFARSHGITEIDRDWNTYKKRNDIEIAKEILERHFGRPATAAELAAVRDTYLTDLRAGLDSGRILPEVLPGVRDTLAALAGRDGPCLALATANVAEAAEFRLRSAGLWPFFHCGGYAEDGADKTEILRAVIAKCGEHLSQAIAPEEILFLGDQPSDVRAAVANGTRFLGVFADERGRSALEGAGAERVVPQLALEALSAL